MWDIVVAGGIIVTAITVIPVFWQLRQHPRGLHILFFAEMWERFSYYGMRGILIFYMTQHFLFNDERAQGQYGAYTSLVYLMPLIGGFLADRYLGNRKAIAFGALLLVGGHFMMAVEQQPAVQTLTYQGQTYEFASEGRQNLRQSWLEVDGQRYSYGAAEGGGLRIDGLPADAPLPGVLPAGSYEFGIANQAQSFMGTGITFVDIFYFALALIIMGVGFLKANISSIVGQLYTQDDPRRDSGFTLYYFGINLGAFWASILCAGLGATYGWWAGFGLAGVGMLLGFLVFTQRRLLFFLPGPAQLPDNVGQPPDPEKLKRPVLGPINREWLIYILGFAGVAVAWWLVQREPVVNWSLVAAAVAVMLYFFWYLMLDASHERHVSKSLLGLASLVLVLLAWVGLAEAVGAAQFGLSSLAVDRLSLPAAAAPATFAIAGAVCAVGAWLVGRMVAPESRRVMEFLALALAAVLALMKGGQFLIEQMQGPTGLSVRWFAQPEAIWLAAGAALLAFAFTFLGRFLSVTAHRIILALILIAAATVFWTLFELAGTALNQFAERNTQLPSNGFFSVTAGQTQSFNAGFILIFAPIFAAVWAFLEKRKADPNDAAKFALGLVQVGAGFLVLVWGAQFADDSYRVPLVFLVLLYLLHTTGELCLSPVGLSAMTKLAPAAIVSTVMATWFLSSSGAQALGAQIAKLTAAETVGGQVLDPAAALRTYVDVFQMLGWGAVGIGLALGIASFWLRKLAHKGVVETPKPEADAKGVAAEA